MFPIEETDLAGVGKRYSLRTSSGERLVIVTLDSGDVEIYQSRESGEEPRPVATLTPEEAKYVAAILGRTIHSPEALDRLNRSGVGIHWYELGANSFAVNRALDELKLTERTGASVVSVIRKSGRQRGAPDPALACQQGDQLAIVGDQRQVQQCVKLLEDGKV
ncbi:MAG: cation:proton antiporter regulatory subunit [Chloroflexota bacterium]